jgi:hypothetical protein
MMLLLTVKRAASCGVTLVSCFRKNIIDSNNISSKQKNKDLEIKQNFKVYM